MFGMGFVCLFFFVGIIFCLGFVCSFGEIYLALGLSDFWLGELCWALGFSVCWFGELCLVMIGLF